MANNCFIYETLNQVSEMRHEVSENGLMTLSGVFGVCGVRNNNKRVYEKSNYAKCVKEMQKRIAENKGIPGELEHPQTMNITLENVSHKITKINIDENGVVTGEIQLLNTPKGKIAQAIVEGGLPLFVSSRAMGNVDNEGNVTLENISSFDLVGTPGFSQAKMHLNESQVCEALGENTWYITEKENTNNMENSVTQNSELLERLEELEARVFELEDANAELTEQLENANSNQLDIRKLADGIQNWVVEEYSATLQNWLVSDFLPHAVTESKKDFVANIAPKIQNWVVEEFAPEIEKWVVEQYSPEIEKWVVEQYSPEVENWFTGEIAPRIQDWIIEQFSPQVENWLNESFMQNVQEKIEEGLQDSKDNKLKSITETLTLLEGLTPAKPKFDGRQINESINKEPVYVANMPEDVRVKYNMASDDIKESIARRAKLYDFTTEGAIERFWENINFEEIKPANQYRSLDTVEDARERQIRESFRRNRRLF